MFFISLVVTAAPEQEAAAVPTPTYQAPTAPAELLKIDEPMRRYFGARLRPHQARADQLRALLEAILHPDGLAFTYGRELTFDPRETFRQRSGNCVSYSFLVVAVAREFGFKASFQNVRTPMQWDRIGDLIIAVRHMNVRVDLEREYYLIDLQPQVLSGAGRSDMRVISDARACAEFYDNMGFFELVRGRPGVAMQYMILATTTDPTCASAWANRASLQAQLGNLHEARAGFERSLQADPQDLFALEGYVGILHRLGGRDDLRIATRYERRAQLVRDRNPYYQERLAEQALERGDLAGAEKLLRRAVKLKADEPQFYERWAKVLVQLDRNDDALRVTAKLEKLRRRLTAEQPRHRP